MKFIRVRVVPVVLCLAMLYPVVWLTYTMYRYVLNVPMEDDFDILFTEWWQVEGASTWWDKLDKLAQQHGFTEHRLVVLRLMSGIASGLMGHVDTRLFMWLALVELIGLIAIFYHVSRKLGLSLLAFLPVVWLLMQPQLLHRNLLWPTTGVSYAMLPLVGYFLYAELAKPGIRHFGVACLLTGLLPLIMGNGILAGFFGIALLAIQHRWKSTAMYSLVVAALLIGYFNGYHSEFTPRHLEDATTYARRFLIVLGNFANLSEANTLTERFWLPILIGSATLAGWLLACGREVRNRWLSTTLATGVSDRFQLVMIGFGAWLIATLGAIAVTRVHLSESYLLNSRYLNCSIPLACIVYLWGIHRLRERARAVLVAVALLLSGGLWIWHQYQAVYVLEQNKTQQLASLFQLSQYGRWEAYPGGDAVWEEHANVVTRKAILRREYRPPTTVLNAHRAALLAPPDTTSSKISLEVIREKNNIHLSNQTLEAQEGDILLVILWSPRHIYVKPAHQLPAGRRAYFLSRKRFSPTGFSSTIDTNHLLPGTYRLRIGWAREAILSLYDTGQSIEVER